MIVILGGGISGISAAYHLEMRGMTAFVFEQRNRWGGLCDNFEIDGFRFDHAVHLSFTKDEYVRELFRSSTDIITHDHPRMANYYYGTWVKHPAQNNLFPLSIDIKIPAIKDFIQAKQRSRFRNYEQWLRAQYGAYFAEHFPMPYTRKYWTTDARNLTIDWVGERMYRPTLEEVLEGAMSDKTPNTYYASEMLYPMKGGYKSFLSKMASKSDIILGKKAVLIDVKRKCVEFADGESVYYEHLISSLPLPDIVYMIKDVPKFIKEATNRLAWTSVALVSLGFNRPQIPPYLWFYIYDEDIHPSRAYSPSEKSKDNAPEGCSSLQFETYFSKYKELALKGDALVEHVIKKSTDMGVFSRSDVTVVDCRYIDYGNVIFDCHLRKNRSAILDYLDTLQISTVGRFGQWDYLWSDQALLSGKTAADNIQQDT